MGLDQYGISRATEKHVEGGDTFIGEWRKHNRLQGWMENLWIEKGNYGEFNCKDVKLSLEDINRLEDAIMNKKLPVTQGFFFGDDSYVEYEEYHLEDDMRFIQKAKKALSKGKVVIYSSWW
jgi:hypothetical protein